MSDLELEELAPAHEKAVREYLSAQIEPQVGRSEGRFRQFLAYQEEPADERRHNIFRMPIRFNNWTLGIVGAALAASLAVLWAGPSLMPVAHENPIINRPTQTNPVSSPVFIQQDVQSQTFDDGTFMTDDNTPMRVIRWRDFDRTRVFDENRKLQEEKVVPEDHVILVPVKTY
jgi:hypothetical protein